MTALDDLLSALEAATEGSRELDTMIERAIDRKMWDRWIPFYTSSIDAALTLVPEGWLLVNLSGADPTTDYMQHWIVKLAPFRTNNRGWLAYKNKSQAALTAPLALVIAALRARKAQP